MKCDKKKMKNKIVGLVIALLLVGSMAALFPFAHTARAAEPTNRSGRDVWISDIGGDIEMTGEPHPNDVTVGETDVQFDIELTIKDAGTNDVNVTSVQMNGLDKLDDGANWQSSDTNDWSTAPTDTIIWWEREASNGWYNESDNGDDDDFWVTTDWSWHAGTPWVWESNFELDWFRFNVSGAAEPGIYNQTVQIDYVKDGTSYDQDQHFVFEIVENTIVVHDTEVSPLWDPFEEMDVRVDHWDDFWLYDGDADLVNVTLKLDDSNLQDGDGNSITIHDPDNKVFVDELDREDTHWFVFRVTVPRDMEYGDYDVDYTFTATRNEWVDGEWKDTTDITNTGTITLTVSMIAEITATIEDNVIEQGTVKSNLNVTFENTGNVDLERIEIQVVTDGFLWFTPEEYYHYGTPDSDVEWFELGELGVGDTKQVEFIVGTDNYLQVGTHKVDFEYQGFFYDEIGEITGTGEGGFVEVSNTMWAPPVEVSDDEPSVFIEVIEGTIISPVKVTLDPVRVTDMGFLLLNVEVDNRGYVDYTDVSFTLHTEGTPFINPEDPDNTTVEMIEDAFPLDAGNDPVEITFGVTVDTAFIEDRLEANNPIYSVMLTMNAVDKDMTEDVELSISSKAVVRGMGPVIMFRGDLSEVNVKAGEEFDLTYTLENIGDEPVRDLKVTLQPKNMWADMLFVSVDAQNAVYYKQAIGAPGAYVWTVEPDARVLNPGETTTVTFHMVASSDMQPGAIYHLDLFANGATAADDDEEWETASTIRSEESKSAKPFLTTELTLIIVVLIAGIFFALGMLLLGKKKEPKPEAAREERTQTPVSRPPSETSWTQETPIEEEDEWAVESEEPEEPPAPPEFEEEVVEEPEEEEEVW